MAGYTAIQSHAVEPRPNMKKKTVAIQKFVTDQMTDQPMRQGVKSRVRDKKKTLSGTLKEEKMTWQRTETNNKRVC